MKQSPMLSNDGLLSRFETYGLGLFALGLWSYRSIAFAGVALLTIAFLLQWRSLSFLLKDNSLGRLAIAWAAYIMVLALVSATLYPDYAYQMLNDGLRLFYLSGFVVVGSALYRHPEWVARVLGLAVAGFFLGRLEHIPDLIARGDAWLTTRDSLGFNTAIPTGEYALIVLLWTLIFFPYLTAGPRMKWLRVILSLAALVVASLCLIISQTRSAWLITPVFVLGLMMTMLFFKRFKNRAILGVAFFSLALLVGLIHENSTVISHRLGQEATTWSKIIHLDFSNITGTNTEGKVLSIGLRFKNIEYGLEKWREKPLFGWGTGAGKMLIDCCAPSSFGRFNDLHNTYVELLVRTGLIGLGLYALLSLQVLRATVDAYRRTATGPEMLLVIIFGLLVHLAISFTSVRILNHDWRFFWFLLAGIALALSTQKPGQTENKLAEKNQPRTGELISRGD